MQLQGPDLDTAAEADGGEREGGSADELGATEGEAGEEDLDGECGSRVLEDRWREREVEERVFAEGFGGFLEGWIDPCDGEGRR